ncbi:MAG: hypothetical protein H7Y01_15550 [Ferruginibacter sp.]|nr:hypothetical protein [Chitinophagaceae bacterium]
MKNIILSFLLLFLSATPHLHAQESTTVKIGWDKKEVLLNGIALDKSSGLKEVIKVVGQANRVLSDDTLSTRLYIYDSLGLAIVIDTVSNQLQTMFIYLSKGRGGDFETSPKKLFTGTLFINEELISPAEKIDPILEKTKLPFKEWSPGFYWYTAANEEFNITITYRDKKKEVITSCYIQFISDED